MHRTHAGEAAIYRTDIMLRTHRPGDNPDLLSAALDYHQRGLSIIPTIGKRAAVAWRHYQDHQADDSELHRLMSRNGITGIAVILGTVSHGLACRDYDRADAYDRWAGAHPDLAATLPTVATSRGYHVYHRTMQEQYRTLADGEYRADHLHYVLLPPSRHPDGPVYQWTIPLPDDIPFVDPVSVGLLPLYNLTQTHEHQADKDMCPEIMSADSGIPIACVHEMDTVHVSIVINRTLPSGPGQRNRRLFDLARHLKAIMPAASVSELEPIVRQWHTAALPVIRTKDWIESWIDFRTAWANVKRPFGPTMAEIAAAAKVGRPKDADAVVRLMALCRGMQQQHGPGKAWPLSCRMAARIIGVSHDTAARILKLLCREGTIELVRPAGPRKSRRAAEYRFLGERQ